MSTRIFLCPHNTCNLFHSSFSEALDHLNTHPEVTKLLTAHGRNGLDNQVVRATLHPPLTTTTGRAIYICDYLCDVYFMTLDAAVAHFTQGVHEASGERRWKEVGECGVREWVRRGAERFLVFDGVAQEEKEKDTMGAHNKTVVNNSNHYYLNGARSSISVTHIPPPPPPPPAPLHITHAPTHTRFKLHLHARTFPEFVAEVSKAYGSTVGGKAAEVDWKMGLRGCKVVYDSKEGGIPMELVLSGDRAVQRLQEVMKVGSMVVGEEGEEDRTGVNDGCRYGR